MECSICKGELSLTCVFSHESVFHREFYDEVTNFYLTGTLQKRSLSSDIKLRDKKKESCYNIPIERIGKL